MEKIENFIVNWNGEFPDYPLSANDLKKPRAVMGALFKIFDGLDIDRDAILKPPSEECRTENMMYFWDMIPVINTTRVINHSVPVMPQAVSTISITHFLQPTMTSSQYILLLLFNLMIFNKERLGYIAPYEEELFSKTNEVNTLEEKKNQLLNMLNQQAEEKGKRAERLEKLDYDIKALEEELQQENEGYAEDKLELEAAENENRQIQTVLDQKKTQRDALVEEIEKKKALRVYDAEDIKTQAEQAARNVQEAEEELKNLVDFEAGDFDADSKEGELEVLQTELSELEVQLAELRVAREEESEKRRENCDKRQREGALLMSNLTEAEENDKRCCEQSARALQRIEEKESTQKYEHEKAEGLEEINKMKKFFTNENEMRAKYNNLWQHVIFKPPPWTLNDVLQCLLKHWIAVFNEVFPRIEQLISDLRTSLITIEKKDPSTLTQSEVSTFKELCLDVARRCQIIPEYMELAKATLAQLSRDGPATDTVDAFEALWTALSSYCAKLSSALGVPHGLEGAAAGGEPLEELTPRWASLSTHVTELADALRGALGGACGVAALQRAVCGALAGCGLRGAVRRDELAAFCGDCRNMLQEAYDKFSQLSDILNVCKSRFSDDMN